MSADQLPTDLFNAGVAVSIISTVPALGMSYSSPKFLSILPERGANATVLRCRAPSDAGIL